MPSPASDPSAWRAPFSRRVLLAGAAAGGLGAVAAGCTPYTVDQPGPPTPKVARGVDPDVALAASVLARERATLELLEATLAEHPRHPRRRALRRAREVHSAHVDLLDAAVPADAPTPSQDPFGDPPPDTDENSDGAGATDASPSPSGPGTEEVRVPGDPARALAAVARAEEDLSVQLRRSAFSAQSGSFARVLASMAAAAAQQTAVLRGADDGGAG